MRNGLSRTGALRGLLPLPDRSEQFADGGTVCGTVAYVMEANDSTGIDQDVPSELKDIAGYFARAPTAGKQLHIRPPCRRSPNMPEPSTFHSIGAVEAASFINQDRPRQAGVANIVLRERTTLKSHDGNLDAESAQFTLILPQLRQVLTAGQSP
jgi:hypothetical protein